MMRARREGAELGLTDCMWAAALAKLTASSVCYPHGEWGGGGGGGDPGMVSGRVYVPSPGRATGYV